MGKIKTFIKEHKTELLIVGGFVAGSIATYLICRRHPKVIIKTIEKLPEWAEKWEEHCWENNLLFENGLPVFANDEQTAIYRDALSQECDVQGLIDQGFEIVDRK